MRQAILDVWKLDGPVPEITTETTNKGPVEWTESFHFSRNLRQRESNVMEDQSPAVTEVIDSNQSEMAS